MSGHLRAKSAKLNGYQKEPLRPPQPPLDQIITLEHNGLPWSDPNSLENAFRAFGGVPRTLCIDNLRAAVKKADWYEPELTPKIESFCRHYDTVVMPCRVWKPEHKGMAVSSLIFRHNHLP